MSISAAEVAQGFQDANTTRYLTGMMNTFVPVHKVIDFVDLQQQDS